MLTKREPHVRGLNRIWTNTWQSLKNRAHVISFYEVESPDPKFPQHASVKVFCTTKMCAGSALAAKWILNHERDEPGPRKSCWINHGTQVGMEDVPASRPKDWKTHLRNREPVLRVIVRTHASINKSPLRHSARQSFYLSQSKTSQIYLNQKGSKLQIMKPFLLWLLGLLAAIASAIRVDLFSDYDFTGTNVTFVCCPC